MSKRTNHYATADTKYVKTTILYGDDNARAFYDEECTEPVYSDEAVDLFLDGVVLNDSTYGIYHSIQSLSKNHDKLYSFAYSGGGYINTTKRPVEVNESNAIFYLEKMTLGGFDNSNGDTLIAPSGENVPVYRNGNRDFEQPITPTIPMMREETYIVNWDGTEYECVMSTDEGGYYLGANYYGISYNGTYPFGIWFAEKYDEAQGITVPTDINVVFAMTPETSHTISIYKMK